MALGRVQVEAFVMGMPARSYAGRPLKEDRRQSGPTQDRSNGQPRRAGSHNNDVGPSSLNRSHLTATERRPTQTYSSWQQAPMAAVLPSRWFPASAVQRA